MNQKGYIYIAAGVIVLAIILYFFFSKNNKEENIAVKVKKGNFPIEVTTTGELLAKSSEKIYGPESLRRMQIYQVKIQDIIPDGTVVDSGQYVASLDKTEITNKIKDEETNLEKFETQCTKTRLDTSLDLRSARDELINLKYALEEKKITLEQSKYEPPATIRQVEIDLDRAQRNLEQAQQNYKLRLQKAIANMQEVTASYTQAQRKLEQLMDVLKQFTITAPKAGMVIYRRNWDGNKQTTGSTLNVWDNVVAELPDLRVMISKTYVNEIDISKIKVGQNVRIGIDAFPEKKFTGKVTEVANIGEQMQNTNAKVYEVKILVNEFDSILRPAMTTKNTIVTAVIDSVLFVPIEGIFNNDSISYVFKKDGGKTVRQQVITGQSNENEIIILAGLTPDDEIYLTQQEDGDNLELISLSQKEIQKYSVKPETAQVPKKKTDSTVKNLPPGTPPVGALKTK
jgi:hypothetical protein